MRSGELARQVGVSSDTLRHYERLGLLATVPRTGNGYREYPTLAVQRVRMIRRALAMGFSLPELATILHMRDQGKLPCRRARDLAHSKLLDLDRQMLDLTVMRHQLREILKDWDSRLRRAGENKPAKLLEALTDRPMKREPSAQFQHSKKRRRHENNSGGSGVGTRDKRSTRQLARNPS